MTVVVAPAKLTWYLEVTGVRPNGYHELRSEMVTLDLHDTLEFADGDRLTIVGAPDLVADDSNLVRRALALVGRRADVRLEKSIPTGGGLGGGSADAAAVLRWAGGVTAAEAVRLGGDVPFCQLGGRALVTGVGEVLEPLPVEDRMVTVFLPPFAVPTGPVYEAFDELALDGRWEARNHLERPARVVEPRLGVVLDWARSTFGDVQLAGSGSSLFLEGHLTDQASWGVESPVGLVRVVQTRTTP
jgi:4-diphosphocytidyl-2-C-methyl-D-erythritol kinase